MRPDRSRGFRKHDTVSAPKSAKMSPKRPQEHAEGRKSISGDWIWGLHAAHAALKNPKRTLHDIYVTKNAAEKLSPANLRPNTPIHHALPKAIDSLLPAGAAHQGIALRTAPLSGLHLDEISAPANGLILVLDQVTDPHNVGAMFRLGAAFGVKGIIMQDRHTPPLLGATTKVAVGAVETVPFALVTNIANTLLSLQKSGWRVTGLAGETELDLSRAIKNAAAEVIVVGAEGPGLRTRVRACCDQLARIPMPGQSTHNAESLNVSTATAIALYEVSRTL